MTYDATDSDSDGDIEVPAVETERLSIGPGHETAHPEDGTDGIQQAIDDLPAEGGLVTLVEGTYTVSDGAQYPSNAIQILKDNVAIVGQGRASEIYVPDNFTPDGDGQKVIDIGGSSEDDNLSGPTAVNGCLLKDFLIDANYQNQGTISPDDDGHNIEIEGSYNKVTNVWSINSTGDGVELTCNTDPSHTVGNLISNCHFRDCQEQLIHFHGTWNTSAIGNYCSGEINNNAVSFFTANTPNKNILLKDNIILNSNEHGVGFGGTDASAQSYSTNIQVIGNVISNHSKIGVKLDENHADNIELRGNRIENNSRGILATGVHDITIKDNEIRDNQNHGIDIPPSANGAPIENFFIKGNNIYDNNASASGKTGILVETGNSAMAFRNIRIKGNEIVADKTTYNVGIQIQGTGATIEDFVVRDNFLKGASFVQIKNDPGVQVYHNDGWITENSGSASVSDGGTISHGLDVAPTYVNLTTSVQGHIVSASAVDGSSITVQLVDDSGSQIGTAETVYWEAKAR